jgi:hypothetical protein
MSNVPTPVSGSARVLSGHVELSLTLPLAPRRTVADTAGHSSPVELPAGPEPTHAPDFASVNWYGTIYTFSKKQRLVVANLWRAHEEGYEWLSQESLLDAADSDCQRLRDLFRGHPAWDAMIVSALPSGGPPGGYRLAAPCSE